MIECRVLYTCSEGIVAAIVCVCVTVCCCPVFLSSPFLSPPFFPFSLPSLPPPHICRYDDTNKYAFVAEYNGTISVIKLDEANFHRVTKLEGHTSEQLTHSN